MTIETAIMALAAFGFAFSACSDAASSGATQPDVLEPVVAQALINAIQDEYFAENTYLRVLNDFGDVLPFRNVVSAEERHSVALARLLERRALEVPLSQWDQTNVPVFDALTDACGAAVSAELANIAMYDVFLEETLPQDVRNVFENNRAASRDRHLPAFRACA